MVARFKQFDLNFGCFFILSLLAGLLAFAAFLRFFLLLADGDGLFRVRVRNIDFSLVGLIYLPSIFRLIFVEEIGESGHD